MYDCNGHFVYTIVHAGAQALPPGIRCYGWGEPATYTLVVFLRDRCDPADWRLPQRSQHIREYNRCIEDCMAAQFLEPCVAHCGLDEGLNHTKQ